MTLTGCFSESRTETKMSMRGVYLRVLLGSTPTEGSRIRQKQKLSCDEVPTKASASPVGSFGAEMVFSVR